MNFQTLMAMVMANPALAGGMGALTLLLVKQALMVAIAYYKPVKDIGYFTADINAFLIEKIELAEKAGVLNWTGLEKAEYVMKEVDTYLRSIGLDGDAHVVTMSWARAQMELIRAELFPSTPVLVPAPAPKPEAPKA